MTWNRTLRVCLLICCVIVTAEEDNDRNNIRSFCGPTDSSWIVPNIPPEYTLIQLALVLSQGKRAPYRCWQGLQQPFDCTLEKASTGSVSLIKTESPKRFYREKILRLRNIVPGDCMSGSLTMLGYEQNIEVGKSFRGIIEIPENPYVVHSAYASSSKAVQGFFKGYFDDDEFLGVHELYQPEKVKDFTFPNADLCPILDNYQEEFDKSDEGKKLKKENEELKALAAKATNDEESDLDLFYDCAMSSFCLNMNSEIDETLLQKIHDYEFRYLKQLSSYPSPTQRGRFAVGFLLNEIADSFDELIRSSQTKADDSLIFSTIESTIPAVLFALGIDVEEMPPYSSYFAFDLLKKENKYFVRMHYNGNVVHPHFCKETICSSNELISFLRSLTPKLSECIRTPDGSTDYTPLIVISIISGIVVFGAVVGLVVMKIRKKEDVDTFQTLLDPY